MTCRDIVSPVLLFFLATWKLMLVVVAVLQLQGVECQRLQVTCEDIISTVLTPNTASTTQELMTCDVPASDVLQQYKWEWDEIAPDNAIERMLPNITDATCEF